MKKKEQNANSNVVADVDNDEDDDYDIKEEKRKNETTKRNHADPRATVRIEKFYKMFNFSSLHFPSLVRSCVCVCVLCVYAVRSLPFKNPLNTNVRSIDM